MKRIKPLVFLHDITPTGLQTQDSTLFTQGFTRDHVLVSIDVFIASTGGKCGNYLVGKLSDKLI